MNLFNDKGTDSLHDRSIRIIEHVIVTGRSLLHKKTRNLKHISFQFEGIKREIQKLIKYKK